MAKVETLNIILPIKVTFYKNDYDSDKEWEDFKKEMLTNKEEALEAFQENVVDADLRDYIKQMKVEISEVDEEESTDED